MAIRRFRSIVSGISLVILLGLASSASNVAAQSSTPGSGLHECQQPAATPAATPIDKDRIIATVSAHETDEAEEASAGADPQADPEADPDPEAESGVLSDEKPVCSVIIEMVDIDFNPNEFTIPANQPVRLVFPNNGYLIHDFTQEELGIDVDVSAGNTGTLVVNIPAGDYDFFCEQSGHAQAGMVGVMHVVAQP